jgi:2-polyprenyl-6-methoxyphenol hydroxylase-like FAD-dependent oxidoreductase
MTDQIDGVVVVGTGPTGLTLGCLLLSYGIVCTIIGSEPGPTSQTRAIGLSARSLEVFDEFAVADKLIACGPVNPKQRCHPKE